MGNKLSYPEVDLTGKVALVTGGNTGIGYETAKALARLGAHTFIACRSKERAESAIEKMTNELSPPRQGNNGTNEASTEKPKEDAEDENVRSKDTVEQQSEDTGEQQCEDTGDKQSEDATNKNEVKIEYIPLDLASFQSTKECVRLFQERNLPLHILVNNAAVLGPTFYTTGDNHETQFQINHLGPVLFTLELLPILVDTATSSTDVRIVFVSSRGHFQAESFDPEQLNKTEEQYKRLKEYCNTKLYNVMSGFCLQRRLQDKNITVSTVHPGYVRTEIDRSFKDMKVLMAIHKVAVNMIARNPVQGAATSLNCVVNPELNSQQHFYYDTCSPKPSSVDSRNEVFQEQMWKKTFEFLKEHLSLETYEKYGPMPEQEPPKSAPEGSEEPTQSAPEGSEDTPTSAPEGSEEPTQSAPEGSEVTPVATGNEGQVQPVAE